MRRPFIGDFPVTQTWGVNEQNYVQFGLKGHNGIDYGLPTGTVIIAPHSGKVIEVAYDQYGYGNYIKIENDVEGSILAHLQQQDVSVGQEVKEGDRIGLSNNSGNSTGPHLHWGYFRKPRDKADGFSGTINPFPYLNENAHDEPVGIPVNIIQKSSGFDKVIIGVWKDENIIKLLDELGLLKLTDERKDNSDKYTGEEVLGFIKGLVERCNHLQPKASNNDRVCNYLGISPDSSFEEIKAAIDSKSTGFKTVGEALTAILPKVKDINL